MARVLEHCAKQLLRQVGIGVPQGAVARDAGEANRIAASFGYPIVVKGAVPIGHKQYLGLVRFVETDAELDSACTNLLARDVGPYVIQELLIERKEPVAREYYVALAIEAGAYGPTVVALVSVEGGIEIESETQRSKVIAIDLGHDGIAPLVPAVRDQLAARGIELAAAATLSRAVRSMFQVFRTMDCELLEINPLAVRPDGSAVALGVVLSIDDASADRHRSLLDQEIRMRSRFPHAPSEKERAVVNSLGDSGAVRYVELDGDIGYMVTGGGASLYCLDRLMRAGLRPACYMDVSPGQTRQGFQRALEAAFSIPNLRAVIGGSVIVSLLKVDEIATAIVGAMQAANVDPRRLPIFMRWAGPGEAVGQDLLRTHGIHCFGDEVTLDEFVDRAVAAVRQGDR